MKAHEKNGEVKTLQQGSALFETVGISARVLAARTRQEYGNDLMDLTAFLEKQGITKLSRVKLPHLESYQAEMDRRGYAASTRQRKTCAIKTFFKFLDQHGLN